MFGQFRNCFQGRQNAPPTSFGLSHIVRSQFPTCGKRGRRVLDLTTLLSLLLALGLVWSDTALAQEVIPTQYLPLVTRQDASTGPAVGMIRTNLADYVGQQVPRFEKLELTFDVASQASNPYLPYDAAPPSGVTPGAGVSVDALFSPDNWRTTYVQPAFYYQEFLHEVRSEDEWIYPTADFFWKVRFSPNVPGNWQYQIVVRDANGVSASPVSAFSVADSLSPGFVRVSQRDPRYFEFDNGAYFPALGYNLPYNALNWTNPVLDNREHFAIMGENGIQLVRFWLTQWSIFGSAWNPWIGSQNNYAGYIPMTGLVPFGPEDTEWSMMLRSPPDEYFDVCRFQDAQLARPAVKPQTIYQVDVTYYAENLASACSAADCGLVVQIGDANCGDAERVTEGYGQDSDDAWRMLSGRWRSDERAYLPRFHLLLDNIPDGADANAFVTHVSIREDLTPDDSLDAAFGPNLIAKPSADHQRTIAQRNAFAFDQVLELAAEYGIYLRPVILEKGDRILTAYDQSGELGDESADNFYGSGRRMTKVRWLQQAWWRYLQARWGYSPNIHSWELLNEGDPWSERHYAMADEFARYMHQFRPNDHLVSTSFWDSYPRDAFWANPAYAEVDFVDIHQYFLEGHTPAYDYFYGADDYYDMALITQKMSTAFGARMPNGAGKPLIRGEIGFHAADDRPSDALLQDTQGIWLHNLLWAGLNHGGLIESYWHSGIHIYQLDPVDGPAFDHRPIFGGLYRFLQSIRLNNGRYRDAAAVVSNEQLRAWGQMDPVGECAHLWIQNREHTWKRVADNVPIAPVTATVQLSGFQPSTTYLAEWWDTYATDPAEQIVMTESVAADSAGSITLTVNALMTDGAVKIHPETGCRP